MRQTRNKVAAIPNIHPYCFVQVIDDSQDPPVWKTIGKCFDTTVAVANVMNKHHLKKAWVKDILGDRRYVSVT